MSYLTTDDVMNRIQEHYNYIKDKYEVVCIMLQGSQNYGLNYEGSDVDTKAIVLPTFNDFILGKDPESTTIVLDNEEHIDVKDIRVMFNMFKKANISYLELLFTDYIIVNPKYQHIVDDLIKVREDIIDYKKFCKACYGMTLEKRKALCHPYPVTEWKINKWGFDGKQLSHLLRLKLMLERLGKEKVLSKEMFMFDGEEQRRLIEIKKNVAEDIDVNRAVEYADELCTETKQIVDDMCTWDWREPNLKTLDTLLIKTLRQYFKEDILNG